MPTGDQSTIVQLNEMRNKIEALSTALLEQTIAQQVREEVTRLGDDNLHLMQSLGLKDTEIARLQEELRRALVSEMRQHQMYEVKRVKISIH